MNLTAMLDAVAVWGRGVGGRFMADLPASAAISGAGLVFVGIITWVLIADGRRWCPQCGAWRRHRLLREDAKPFGPERCVPYWEGLEQGWDPEEIPRDLKRVTRVLQSARGKRYFQCGRCSGSWSEDFVEEREIQRVDGVYPGK